MKYTVGIDFGTLSARAVVINAENGTVVSQGECGYAVYQDRLPDATPLPKGMIVADPRQYQDALVASVRAAVRSVPPSLIAGIAVDATSLTLVPTDSEGRVICTCPRWASQPDAWIKLWKSHSAQAQADRIQKVARETGHPLLRQCGGRISSEWAYPKMLETYDRSPELFRRIDTFWDLCDWLTWLLCGEKTRSQGAMCNKFHYDGEALPDESFWNQVRPGFGTELRGKLNGVCLTWGETAGYLLPRMAEVLGLPAGIPVAAGSLDGHIAMTSLGLSRNGDAMLTVGTSAVFAVLAEGTGGVPGICGSGIHAMIPGKTGYDTGQCSVGDTLAWFIENQVPQDYHILAREKKDSIHTLLSNMAFSRPPQADSPIALDWWNGNRCIRGDLNLRGMIYGLSLTTKAEDIYRALVESAAFGLRNILDNFERHQIPVRRLRASGGIAQKNPHFMQCYADVLGMPIEVSGQGSRAAVGAAITAAVAGGVYKTLSQAMDALAEKNFIVYTPRTKYATIYGQRYACYKRLDHFFGEQYGRKEEKV